MKTNEMADTVRRGLKIYVKNFNDCNSPSVLALKDSNFIYQHILLREEVTTEVKSIN